MAEPTKPRSRLRGLYDALVMGDPMERFRLLRKAARWLVPSYKLKWPDMDWWSDPFFAEFLTRFDEADGLNADRRWMLYQLARLAAHVPGNTAECGAYQGAGSYLICAVNAAAGQTKTHRIFDSFEGLSAPKPADGQYWQAGDLTTSQALLEQNLAAFKDALDIYPGWIPESFATINEGAAQDSYAFVHIDVDLYEPTLASLEYFYSRMTTGGIILCDDYGLGFCPGATKAFNEFVDDKPENVISLSGGSGYLVKGTATSAPITLI